MDNSKEVINLNKTMNKENAPCGWRDDGLPEPDPREYEEYNEQQLSDVSISFSFREMRLVCRNLQDMLRRAESERFRSSKQTFGFTTHTGQKIKIFLIV